MSNIKVQVVQHSRRFQERFQQSENTTSQFKLNFQPSGSITSLKFAYETTDEYLVVTSFDGVLAVLNTNRDSISTKIINRLRGESYGNAAGCPILCCTKMVK